MLNKELHHSPRRVAVVGGGLAGCECALYLARYGTQVTLFEQKPTHYSPAHVSPHLAELVCSNSLRSDDPSSGIGLLKLELRELDCALMKAADATRVPAGKALAVDREQFSAAVEDAVLKHPNITLISRQIESLDDPAIRLADADNQSSGPDIFDRVVIAAGPVASDNLSNSLAEAVGGGQLYFYDAIAPIVAYDSINTDIAFWGSRYGDPGEGDYLNCPFDENQYRTFYKALIEAEKISGHNFEKEIHFEGCMPIEALAARGERTLTFGPMKPVGLVDPRTGKRPWAALQLRPENINRSMFNLVGCQTKMTYPAQDTVFRLVPGLENAEFIRHGSMHRNTYVNAPIVLNKYLELNCRPRIHLAGQMTGVEGYVESIACGLWVGMTVRALFDESEIEQPPITSALGALLNHLAVPNKHFQPSNAHFGLMPEPEIRIKKKERKAWYAERARADFAEWRKANRDFLAS